VAQQSRIADSLVWGIIFLVFTKICLLVPLVLSGAFAQQDSNLRVQSNVVLVPTLVKDAEGRVIYGLTQNDFLIDDDGVEQTVRLDDSAESEPASVVVAIQTGRRAWREYSRMSGVGPMLTAVFNQLRSRVALVEFDSHVRLVEDFSEDQTSVYDDLKKLEPGDNEAAIRDAVDFSVRLLEKEPPERQRVLLLVSENRDHEAMSAKLTMLLLPSETATPLCMHSRSRRRCRRCWTLREVSTGMKPTGTRRPT